MFKKNDNKETITLTREELRKKFFEVIENPFKGKEIEDDKAQNVRIGIMLHGMLLLQRLEEELFGEEEQTDVK